jgi:hypothetical protein
MIDATAANTATELPGHFPVTVIMQRRRPAVSQWVDYIWTAIGVTVGDTIDTTIDAAMDASIDDTQDTAAEPRVVHLDDDVQLRIYSGYQVRLYVDECDSYYHNLVSPSPHCYIVVRQNEDEPPRPFLVSLSFDEADAYAEGEDEVFVVDIPPELYRWSEAFVLTHYCPEQRKKRKRQDWWENDAEHQSR